MRWVVGVAAWVGFVVGGCGPGSHEACGGVAPLCTTQALSGSCSDAVDEVEATCEGETWVCDEGYHLASEGSCQWPSYCDGVPPRCDDQVLAGPCRPDVQSVAAQCSGDVEWACPPGFHFEHQTMCTPVGCGPDPAPLCTDQATSGECSDAVSEVDATCVDGEYVCPDGHHFEDVGSCDWPESCDGGAPMCYEGGDCGGAVEPAACDGPDWVCPRGYTAGCTYPCGAGEPAPDDCWDQGPGECSDTTQLPSCVDDAWTCPAGWDFGGFGEGCEFPP